MKKIQYEIIVTDANRQLDIFEIHRQLQAEFGNCKMRLITSEGEKDE